MAPARKIETEGEGEDYHAVNFGRKWPFSNCLCVLLLSLSLSLSL